MLTEPLLRPTAAPALLSPLRGAKGAVTWRAPGCAGELQTQPSRLQGWSNLFMSTAKEAPDLGHHTAGNGIYRSQRGEERSVTRFQ